MFDRRNLLQAKPYACYFSVFGFDQWYMSCNNFSAYIVVKIIYHSLDNSLIPGFRLPALGQRKCIVETEHIARTWNRCLCVILIQYIYILYELIWTNNNSD